jgi:hypothetical protein
MRSYKRSRTSGAHLVALHRAGEHSTAELGDLFGVGRTTVYRALERDNRRVQHASSFGASSSTSR